MEKQHEIIDILATLETSRATLDVVINNIESYKNSGLFQEISQNWLNDIVLSVSIVRDRLELEENILREQNN